MERNRNISQHAHARFLKIASKAGDEELVKIGEVLAILEELTDAEGLKRICKAGEE
jgi:hypothetical protein